MFFKEIPESLPPPEYFLRDYASPAIMWAVRGALLLGLMFALIVCIVMKRREARKKREETED